MSREARIENMGEALRLMMEEAGERCFDGVFINANGKRYEAIQNTTWKELTDRYFIRASATVTWLSRVTGGELPL